MSYSDIYTVCYNRLTVFKTKEDAKKFYIKCYYLSEGEEQKRYASILVDLNFSNLGKDNISNYCSEISLKLNDQKEEFLKVKMGKNLSIEETIKYYEEKIKPILKVSEEYNVDFNNSVPFEHFGSDDESQNFGMYSFSEFYKKILEKNNIEIGDISTREKSVGKYIVTIDNNFEFEINAWEKLDKVFDNIESMINIIQEKGSKIGIEL